VTGAGLTFFTLGPSGTCHEHVLERYLEFQGLPAARVELVDDLLDGLERVRELPGSFLLQNSAHPTVAEATERHWSEVFVVDTFICPTKTMGLLRRAEVEHPKSLGIMPATVGYIDLSAWETVVYEPAKPLIGRSLLAGAYDAGLTHLEWAERHPDGLRVIETIGPVDTTWLLYGRTRRARGELVGMRCPELFAAAEAAA